MNLCPIDFCASIYVLQVVSALNAFPDWALLSPGFLQPRKAQAQHPGVQAPISPQQCRNQLQKMLFNNRKVLVLNF